MYTAQQSNPGGNLIKEIISLKKDKLSLEFPDGALFQFRS